MAGHVVYRGYGPDNPAGPRLVVIEDDDGVIGPLPHAELHSPDGFSWGYCGSAPADLARSLLIHALGEATRCRTCRGSGMVLCVKAIADGPEPVRCNLCEKGHRISRDMYQQFKADVVAKLPIEGWRLTRGEVQQWLSGWTQRELDAATG